jgi:Protein of unknown function (DUF2397)
LLFLQLLGDALAAGPPGTRGIEAISSDGTLAIRLQPVLDGAVAEIHTPDGVLRGADHVITISDSRAEAPERAAAQ